MGVSGAEGADVSEAERRVGLLHERVSSRPTYPPGSNCERLQLRAYNRLFLIPRPCRKRRAP